MASSGKFTWRITDFSVRQSETRIYSDVFTVGGCKWRIRVDPNSKSRERDDVVWLSVYLEVADIVGLPSGWRIDVAKYSLTVVNQLQSSDSTTYGSTQPREFTALESIRGWRSFKRLTELHDSSKGYLVNDTLVVEAEIEVLKISPPTVFMLETFLSNLDKFITDVDQGQSSVGSSFNSGLKSKVPSLKKVKMAKQSLKECLSDIFKLDIKDRLATSLETLSRAKKWLSSEEQRAVEVFWGEFDDFVAIFLTFEHENTEFELHKLAIDQMLHSIKNYHETHISKKRRLDDLTKEEEEYKKRMEEAKKRMEEVKSEKTKLISDWHTLMMESEKTKSEYTAQEKKLEEAKERKKLAEERMSNFTAAWSSLKAHFAN